MDLPKRIYRVPEVQRLYRDLLAARVSAAGSAAYPVAKYYGYDTVAITWTSTTWSGIHNVLTIVDHTQTGITRSNSDWTIDDAGDYTVDFKAGAFKSGVPAHIGVRLMLNGVEVAQGATATNNSAQLTTLALYFRCNGLVANDVLTLEYCVTAAFGSYGATTLNGEAARIANISIDRVK